jgi:colicin import membrane protein
MTTTIAEYSKTEAALSDLRTRFSDVVFNVATTKGMDEAKKARSELREYRVSLEKQRVEIKAPALERCRQIDSEARRITIELTAIEDPIDGQIKKEEDRKAIEKAAKEAAERERIEAINARFDAIKALPLRAVNASAEDIRAVIADAETIDPATFPEELQSAAKYERQVAINGLRASLDRREADDDEQVKIAAEREELAKLRAEQEAMRAEADRLAQAERDRIAADEQRKEALARAERDAIENAQRQAREAEQARIDAERAEARKREDAERAAAEKKLRQEQADAAAERARLEDDKKAADKRAKQQAIATATLHSAAGEALALLQAEGFADHLVTHKLAAALGRESVQQGIAA